MTNPVARVVSTNRYGGDGPSWRTLYVWCPACDTLTALPLPGVDGSLPTNGRDHWQWDGDLLAPTVSPSILQHQSEVHPLCHSFLRAGRWEFLGDCTHKLAGQTVDMVPLPDWVVDGT
jgi:hypothetical protein